MAMKSSWREMRDTLSRVRKALIEHPEFAQMWDELIVEEDMRSDKLTHFEK
jgi:hypothetical protein